MADEIVRFEYEKQGYPEDFYPPFNRDFFPIIPITVAVYLLVVFLLHREMKKREPLELKWPLVVHNFIMTLISVVILVGLGYEILKMLINNGVFSVYCGTLGDADLATARWNVAFYLTKYYELIDTMFVILRKKELTVLHVFHHAIVIPMCWMAVDAEIFMGWITSFNNAFVHTIMYAYFFLTTFGYRPWWRQYITSVQILQFIIDMLSSGPFILFYIYGYRCRGMVYAWVVANIVGFSLFLLFVNFYIQNYISKKKGASDPAKFQKTKKTSDATATAPTKAKKDD